MIRHLKAATVLRSWPSALEVGRMARAGALRVGRWSAGMLGVVLLSWIVSGAEALASGL